MKRHINDFMLRGGDFEETALQLWNWQCQHNPDYGRICQDQMPSRWQDIPAIPVALFRDLSLTCFPPMAAAHCFRTSGTTGPRGTHLLQDTELYDLGAALHMQNCIGGVPQQGISLVSPAADSSLGHMCRSFAPRMMQGFIPDVGVLSEECHRALEQAEKEETPLFIPATAFAMVVLLEALGSKRFSLHPSSVMMITGGFKGRKHQLSESDIAEQLEHCFPNIRIVSEYGMTELSSQLWATRLGEPFTPPHWMKVTTVDPESGQALPTGTEGLLKFVDLANHQTVLAVETRDKGVVFSDGTVGYRGRQQSAASRGCSLSVEEVDRYYIRPAAVKAVSHPVANWMLPDSTALKLCRTKISHWLESLRKISDRDLQSIAEGLSLENARWGWEQSLSTITMDVLAHPDLQPSSTLGHIVLICAQGVFTAHIEWMAVLLNTGCELTVKAPRSNHTAIELCCQLAQKYDLPVQLITSHELPPCDAIYVFGSDETIEQITRDHPTIPVRSYGHKFSVAISDGRPESAASFALDVVAYDGRGCMAPVGCILTSTENTETFTKALYLALAEAEQLRPLGTPDPALGPELRRQIGLAQAKGQLLEGGKWRVLILPFRYITPIALPRTACIYLSEELESVENWLKQWQQHLSTLSTDHPTAIRRLFPVVCNLGHSQRPPLPRNHDGLPMLLEPCVDGTK